MPGENHGWMRLDRYLAIHQSCMDQVEDYFVVDHDLQAPSFVSLSQVRFTGVIPCHDGIEIHVDQILERDSTDRVRPSFYRYHVQFRVPVDIEPLAPRVVNILRYDNAHPYPDHPDPFHKHLFTSVGKPAGVEHIGREHFPTLRNVIDEVFEWWKERRDRLPGNS